MVKLDIDTRATAGMVFGLFCLAVQLIGSMFGLPVSAPLAGVFGSIVLGSFGAGVLTGRNGKGPE